MTVQIKNNECQHEIGCMIPQRDIDGNYIKPEFMRCNNCNLILLPPTDYTRGRIMN